MKRNNPIVSDYRPNLGTLISIQFKPVIMYKHFSDKKASNKIKLGRVNSKLTDDQLIEIRKSAGESLSVSQRHLKDAVLKSLEAFNIDVHEDGIEERVIFLVYSKPGTHNDLISFVKNTLGKLEVELLK